ncbi:uncharacterized protein [Parasteatoda tepidariorum]|uniref:uncharacterized protein n=1 Tax=Parasteatoda tepidariorum TaxID=114398 RepID=UPI00077FAEE6|nr:uncharacterized protein LOC107438864 [Parasteatoda tepidariorum]
MYKEDEIKRTSSPLTTRTTPEYFYPCILDKQRRKSLPEKHSGVKYQLLSPVMYEEEMKSYPITTRTMPEYFYPSIAEIHKRRKSFSDKNQHSSALGYLKQSGNFGIHLLVSMTELIKGKFITFIFKY